MLERDEKQKFELNDEVQLARYQAAIPTFARDRSLTTGTPVAIFNIEITNRCPLRCVMCPRTHDMHREEGLMSFSLFRKLIDELAERHPEWSHQVPVRLHGFGESLVHPHFAEFIRYAEGRGVNTCLSINPIVMTSEISDKLLEAAPSLLYISLDGHNDETFHSIRGLPRAYERSKINLLRFLEWKQQRASATRIVLSMIDFFLNNESVQQASRYWSGIPGIDEIRVKPFCSWDGNATSVNQLVGIEAPLASNEPVTCRWPWTSVTVLWDGAVVPCCFDFDKRHVLGDANAESLSDIWNGQRMQALRAEFQMGSVANALCTKCASLRSAPPSAS